jgi:hypothetical protein
MGQAGAVIIDYGRQKHLGFVFEAPEGIAVNNAIPIDLKDGPYGAEIFRNLSSPGPGTGAGEGRHERPFAPFEFLSDGHRYPQPVSELPNTDIANLLRRKKILGG